MSATLRELLRLGKAPRSRLAMAATLGALTVVFGAGLMGLAGYLISRAAERPVVLSLMVAIVGVRFFGLGRPLIRYSERLSSHDLALRVLGGIRAHFYERIEPLAPAGLDSYRSGDLLSRMVADVDSLQNLYLRGLQPPLVALLSGSVAIGVTSAFLPEAGVALAIGLVAGGVAVPAIGGFLSTRASRRQAGARGELSAEVVEVTDSAPELVAFGAQRSALERIRTADAALVALARRDALASGISDAIGLVVTGLTLAAVLAVAVNASAHHQLDRVLIAALALLAVASFEAVTPLAAAVRELLATVAAGRRILELADREADVQDPAAPAPAPSWPFTVELDDVRARYSGQGRPVLEHLSLRLEPGEQVALLGPSGAGKTTVVNLLLRFLDSEAGQVKLAERDVRDYRQEDIRRAVSVAGQDSHLFTASIRDNVRLSHPDASEGEIEEALHRAKLSEWIRQLPDGLQTLVGEEGRELSGGQRQRIILARALLGKAPVLVLDEPTAHLDPDTAGELVRDVLTAARGRTVLLITHRSEGLELVDRVVSL